MLEQTEALREMMTEQNEVVKEIVALQMTQSLTAPQEPLVAQITDASDVELACRADGRLRCESSLPAPALNGHAGYSVEEKECAILHLQVDEMKTLMNEHSKELASLRKQGEATQKLVEKMYEMMRERHSTNK